MSEEDHRAGEPRKWWIQFSWWAAQRGPGLKVGGSFCKGLVSSAQGKTGGHPTSALNMTGTCKGGAETGPTAEPLTTLLTGH